MLLRPAVTPAETYYQAATQAAVNGLTKLSALRQRGADRDQRWVERSRQEASPQTRRFRRLAAGIGAGVMLLAAPAGLPAGFGETLAAALPEVKVQPGSKSDRVIFPKACSSYEPEPEIAPGGALIPSRQPAIDAQRLADKHPEAPDPTETFDWPDATDLAHLIAEVRQRTVRYEYDSIYSNMHVTISTNRATELSVDTAAHDFIVHANWLMPPERHEVDSVRRLAECYRDNLLGDTERSDINVEYFYADQEQCIKGFRLVHYSAGCDWTGFALPVNELIAAAGQDITSLRGEPYLIVVAPGIGDGSRDNQQLIDKTGHESGHLGDWAMGQSFTEFIPNERRNRESDDVRAAWLTSHPVELDNAFAYRD